MTDDKREELRVQALNDQVWAAMNEHLPAILRIAEHGPELLSDNDLVRLVFHGIAGELYWRAHLANTGSGEMTP